MMFFIIQRVEQLELETKAFGFYWENAGQVLQQIISECDEIREHLDPNSSASLTSTLKEELGDLLHAAFSLCVFCQLDPEKTLTEATDKFERRFRCVQELARAQGLESLHGLPFPMLMELWDKAKGHAGKISPLEIRAERSFVLDPRLDASCFILKDWPLCRVLLKNNAEYPWLILVPRRLNVVELTELNSADSIQLMFEINRACDALRQVFRPDKINMGALGNVVSQFHYHVIARFQHDALWPEGVWQKSVKEQPYLNPEDLIEKLRDALSLEMNWY